MESHANSSRAVLLDLGDGRFAAIAPHQMVEVLTEAEILEVPEAPAHCRERMPWRGELLPVFDLARWQVPAAPQGGFLAVVSYQRDPDQPLEHGCLRLAGFPSLIPVRDDQACTLPDESWSTLAVACFREAEGEVPILKLEAVFGRAAG